MVLIAMQANVHPDFTIRMSLLWRLLLMQLALKA